MTITIKTKDMGTMDFSAPAATETYAGYVWVEGGDFTQRRQICYGGDIKGNTVTATTASLRSEAERWIKARRRMMQRA
jgi:hypothetical protein